MNKLSAFLLSLILFANCSADKEKICRLTGKVIDRNSTTLVLKKQTQDSRNRTIKISIDSTGYFEHEMDAPFVEAYELIFEDELNKGRWRPIVFFNDSKHIAFTLYPMDQFERNKIEGSELSLEPASFNKIIEDKFYNKYYSWDKKLDSLKNIHESDSDYAIAISDSISNLMKAVPQFELEYIKKDLNEFGYSRFLKILRNEQERKSYEMSDITECAGLFGDKYPGHPYNEIAKLRMNGIMNIRVGGEYVDFSAPDSTGRDISLSERVGKNKVTLIDLWAPWCGPCIRKSKKLVPVYEEFADDGFEVVGVIGGINTEEKYKMALDKHRYPWPLLAEIDNKNNLWEKYYISKGGGGQFLVDNNGKILAINPSPEEVRKYILEE